MKVLLAIPSKKRANVLLENALSWAPWASDLPYQTKDSNVQIEYRVFVEKEDFADYEKAGVLREKMVVLPESNRGLGYAKGIIWEYAGKNEYDYIFKVDDDIKGWTNFRTRLRGKEAGGFFSGMTRQIVNDVFVRQPLVAAVSFPYSFQMFEAYDYKKTKRVQTAYITRRPFFHHDDRISVHEDFAVGLNAIVENRLVLCCGLMGIELGVKVGGDKTDETGGHQALDRVRGAQQAEKAMLEMYPALKFREVDKRWKREPDLRSIKTGLYAKSVDKYLE